MAKKYISKIAKDGQTLDIKDAEAREAIASSVSASYVPTLSSAPTSSTTTYTKDGKTVNFEIGQYARVADATADTGYKFFQLYDLSGGVAKWKVVEDYTPEKLGFGIGTCSTAAATAAKEVSITGYQLVKNGYVTVTFENSVPANATLNINSLGAKPIFFKGDAIVQNVINAGDTVTFVYDGTNYVISHPMKVSKVTIRTFSDAEKTTPTEAVLDITLPNGITNNVKVRSTGVATIYSIDGNATVSSLYSSLDINSFVINGDTIVDIVVANTPFVDMGLPSGIFWARGNIVKDSQGNYYIGNPTDGGAYFSWGNVDGYYWNSDSDKENYDFSDANYALTPGSQLTASIASNDAEHDAALARLGDGWHMPSAANFQELFNSNNCTWAWVTLNSFKGALLTSKNNGNTIFFPASGRRDSSNLSFRGMFGDYWSSSYKDATLSFSMFFRSDMVVPVGNGSIRKNGFTIRPVL